MTIYLIALVIATVGGLIIKSTFGKKYGVYYNSLMAIVAILISGLRHFTVGHDTLQFYRAYTLLGNRAWSELSRTTNYEWGYKILNKVLHTITADPQFLIFVTSTFIVIAFAVFIHRYSDGYILSWVIYLTWLFPNNANLLRQSIAVSLLLFGTHLLKKEGKLKYPFLAAFATLFHRSAIFAVIVWLIVRIKNKLMAVVACIAATSLGIVLIQLPFLQTSIRYSNYFSHTQYGGADFFGNFLKLLIAVVTLVFSCICFRKDVTLKQLLLNKKEDASQVLSNSSLIIINVVWVLIGILAIYINIFDRLFLYFDYFMLIILPRACMNLSRKNQVLLVPLMIILFIIMFVGAVRYTNYAGIAPYRFFWQRY